MSKALGYTFFVFNEIKTKNFDLNAYKKLNPILLNILNTKLYFKNKKNCTSIEKRWIRKEK